MSRLGNAVITPELTAASAELVMPVRPAVARRGDRTAATARRFDVPTERRGDEQGVELRTVVRSDASLPRCEWVMVTPR